MFNGRKQLLETPNGTIDLTADDSVSTPAVLETSVVYEEPVELGLRSRLRSGRREASSANTSSTRPNTSRNSTQNKRINRFLNLNSTPERVTPSSSPDVVFIGAASCRRADVDVAEIPAKKQRKSSPSKNQPVQDINTGRSSLETVFSCPICFDTREKVSKSGRHWSSTICGHVYCNKCIESAISAQGCCPNCRKKLTKRSVHPLYL